MCFSRPLRYSSSMHPALLIALLAAFLLACGIVVTVVAFRRAPDGYEDESGFHVIPTPKSDDVTVPAAATARTDARFGSLHAGLSHVTYDLPQIRDMIGR